MSNRPTKSGDSVLTFVVGFGFLIVLTVAITAPIALLIDFVTYNPGTAASAAGYALPVILIGLGIVWFITKAKDPAQDAPPASARPRLPRLRAWWTKWRPIIHDLSAISGILTPIIALLGWFFTA